MNASSRTRLHEGDETLDLVSAEGVKIDLVKRSEIAKQGYISSKGYVSFVEGFLVNIKGEIWVPSRGLHKVIAPGGLDFSVGEHVLSGESYEQAIERGFHEEAGMRVKARDLVRLGTLSPAEDKPSYEVVFACMNYQGNDPAYSHDEFTGGQWLTPRKLKELLISGVPAKSALLPALKLFMAKVHKT